MRLRTVKPGFFKNEALAEVPPLGRILFEGLWCMADREGRLEDRPKRIKAEVLPYDDCDIDTLLNELAQRHFILRYEAQGDRYIWVVKFKAHQFPNKREANSTLPAPSEAQAFTVLSPYFHSESTGLSQDFHSGISVTPLLRSSVSPLDGIPPVVPPDGGTLSPALEKLIPPGKPKPEPPDGNSQSKKPTRAAKTTPRAAPVLTSQEQAKLVEKWAGTFGLEGVGDRIAEALDHEAARKRGKSGSWYAYVNGWLRDDATKGAARLGPAAIRSGAAQLLPNGHGPPGLMVAAATDELTQEQIERDRETVERWKRVAGKG